MTHRLSDFEQRLLSIHVLSRASRQIVLRRRGEGVTVKEVDLMFPISSKPRETVDFRVRKAEASLWWFQRLAPGADSVYPLRAWTPHECVAIHSYSLLSDEFVSTCRVPTYEAFLHNKADLTPVYRWQKRFLQHLHR